MHGALRFEVAVQLYACHAEFIGDGIAEFLIERCLVIETRSEAETEIAFPTRDPFHRGARGGEYLIIPTPPLQSAADGEYPLSGVGIPFMLILDVCLKPRGLHRTIAPHRVIKLHRPAVIRH